MSLTGIIITGILITIALYDLVVVVKHGVGCSVSRFMQKVGFRSPIFSFVTGAIIGHFWLYMPPEEGQEVIIPVEIKVQLGIPVDCKVFYKTPDQ
jgi:hypothetical protein